MIGKRKILILLVVIEVIIGSIFLSWFYFKVVNKKQYLSNTKVALIPKDKTIANSESDLKFYYELKPHEYMVDKVFWLDQDIEYTINNDGLNDSLDYEVEKKPGTRRIVIIGDSFTYGQNVDTKNNWTEVLERLLNDGQKLCGSENFEVINLGMPGFDIEEMVRRYKRIGQKYQPDLILWFESGSGFVRFNEIMQPFVQSCLGNKNGDEVSLLDFEQAENLNRLENCTGYAVEKLLTEYSLEKRTELINTYLDEFFSLQGTDHAVFYYYDYYFQEKGYNYAPVIESFRQRYPNVAFVDDAEFTPKDEAGKFIDGHPNVLGHQKIAQTIFDHLLNNNLLCQ